MRKNLHAETVAGNVAPAMPVPIAWREYQAAMSRMHHALARITVLSDALDLARAEVTYALEDAADALRRLAGVSDVAA